MEIAAALECPHCGEPTDTFPDPGVGAQEYVEDCVVCCRPIRFVVRVDDDGDFTIEVREV